MIHLSTRPAAQDSRVGAEQRETVCVTGRHHARTARHGTPGAGSGP
ncbi:hypothetical protein [Streptomyces sp. NPDC052496]